jgi:hypothetical protein
MNVLTFDPTMDHIDRCIKHATANPAGVAFRELLLGVRDRRVSVTSILNHRTAWTPRSLLGKFPTIVIIGDDAGASHDPNEWRCSMATIAWARAAIVHGTGAQAWHYKQAIAVAEAYGRCLFVETDSAHASAWVDAIRPRGIPGLMIVPPPGGVPHPLPAGEGLQ